MRRQTISTTTISYVRGCRHAKTSIHGTEGSMAEMLKGAEAVAAVRDGANGQVVVVLQGGGALGAYQVGVYQALHEAGVEPDWVVGTSIGAINAALIAGNPPARRLE